MKIEKRKLIKNPDKGKNTVSPINTLMRIKDIAQISSLTLPERTKENYSFYYLDLSSVKEGKIQWPKEKILFANAPSRARRILQQNDVIVSTVRPNLKGFAIADFKVKDIICSTGFALIKANSRDDARFIYQSLYSSSIEKQLDNLVVGSNYPAINNSDVENLLIFYPNSFKERKKISDLLFGWDKAIETTEKLILIKEQLKKGLMQQLLTEKKRLKEFKNIKWKEVELGEVFSERVETGFTNLQLLSITANNGVVKRDTLDKKDTSNEDKRKYLRIMPGDIGYNTMRLWQGVAGVSEYEGIVSPAYTIITPSKDIDVYFMSYLFKYPPIVHKFWRYSQGLVNDTLNCKFCNFAKIKVKIPSKKEQGKIADILKKIDKELAVLSTKLEFLKEQKKGLMQILLTGKVRVKV